MENAEKDTLDNEQEDAEMVEAQLSGRPSINDKGKGKETLRTDIQTPLSTDHHPGLGSGPSRAATSPVGPIHLVTK